jgi:hypothetical protein
MNILLLIKWQHPWRVRISDCRMTDTIDYFTGPGSVL